MPQLKPRRRYRKKNSRPSNTSSEVSPAPTRTKKSASTPRPSGSNQTSLRHYNNRGLARQAKGDLDGALDDYNEAIRLKPDEADVYYNRGITRKAKGDMDGALDDYNEAIRLKPDDVDGL